MRSACGLGVGWVRDLLLNVCCIFCDPVSSIRWLSKYQKRNRDWEDDMSKLNGKIAVVTGASKGIGASIAEHLAAEGASVVVNYSSSKSGADAVVERIASKGGKAIAVP